MTIIGITPDPPAPAAPLEAHLNEVRCFICGGKPAQCAWLAHLLATGEMGWHPRPLTSGLIPEFAQGLGEMLMTADRKTGQVRPRLLLPVEVDGEVLASKMSQIAEARAAHAAQVALEVAADPSLSTTG